MNTEKKVAGVLGLYTNRAFKRDVGFEPTFPTNR